MTNWLFGAGREQLFRLALLAVAFTVALTLPASERRNDTSDSDKLIEHHARGCNVDPLPVLSFYTETLLPLLTTLHDRASTCGVQRKFRREQLRGHLASSIGSRSRMTFLPEPRG
jgi:hypothetical protein